MFYYLEGTVTVTAQNLAVLDINGVGYACMTTLSTLSHLEKGNKVKLYTYCNIKEDAFDIYGFYDTNEKRCFEQLLSVSGVGPKAALSILSSASPEALALAIIGDDETMLTRAPGVGKKLAQRIILELKDKVSKEMPTLKASGYVPAVSGQASLGTKQSDAAAALAVLGYSQGEISTAMRNIDVADLTVEEIVREVLKISLK
ncbi:MAG: Holliday junction branch migration protein RuvA [Oscillospiraceae bacterium]|nr:Holliday junction branch migration protein RuvA [Oscillospiraceae bacterium]MCL2278201.1 Holliday junction branch migration protein RuvA [Oscillospiraceae bacterium]